MQKLLTAVGDDLLARVAHLQFSLVAIYVDGGQSSQEATLLEGMIERAQLKDEQNEISSRMEEFEERPTCG